ncbi:MAG: histidine phosphatase family protein [Bdellovibrionota bacterium]
MKKLFIFRHGETDWNAAGRFQGHLDIPLNDCGRDQAKSLVKTLNEQKIEAVLSSDLKRALETAQIVAEHFQIPVFTDAGLREAHLGEAQGLTYSEIETKFGETATRWKSRHLTDADISYPGGESGTQVFQRTMAAIEKFFKDQDFSRIGLSCHGGVIRRIMQNILPPGSDPVPIPNAVLYILEYNSKNKSLGMYKKN